MPGDQQSRDNSAADHRPSQGPRHYEHHRQTGSRPGPQWSPLNNTPTGGHSVSSNGRRITMGTVGFLLGLGVAFTLCGADYPPHDITYRVHYHDLYPKEVPNSKVCIGRGNGAYSHHNLDLGDPRCTYVVCSNARQIIQSCPRGTRTMYNIQPAVLAHAHGAPHRTNALFSPPFAAATDGATTETSNVNQIEAGPAAMLDRAGEVHLYSPVHFHLKMCNVHDVFGVCGNPFPDLNAYSNEIPKAGIVPEG